MSGGLEYRGLTGLRGPLAFVQDVPGVSFHEHVDVIAGDVVLTGRVLAVTGRAATIEIFGATDGLSLPNTRVPAPLATWRPASRTFFSP